MADPIVADGTTGAAAGGAAGGPWGAAIGGASGVIAGLINSGNQAPTPNLAALFATISQSGQQEQQLINQLPVSLQPLYAQYKASLGQAGTQLQGATTQIGQTLQNNTSNLYGPNAPAVQATLAALKQQDYSTQPGTINALKANLAATGGLSRGGAANAITKATLAPAAQFSQQAANVTGTQLQTQQQNVQAAINKIAAMDDATANSLFGMSTAQATQILQSGRQDLQAQLAQMINQINTQTTQTLNLNGIQSNAGYQNAVAQNAGQEAIVNGLTNTGAQGIYAALASPGTSNSSGDQGYNPNTDSTPNYANGNPSLYGIGQ